MLSRAARLLPVLVACLAIALSVRPLGDFDAWYHLAAGRELWRTGGWPATNVFSFAAGDRPDVDLYWLFQLVLYGAHVAGGPTGCILLVAGLVLATVGVLHATARRHASDSLVAVLVGLALVVASPRFVPRPELVGFLLLAAFLYFLDGYPRGGRAIWALVPLQVVWTNAHGTVPIGILVAACYALGATLAFLPLPPGWRLAGRCTGREWRRIMLVLALLVLAVFVNPWGLAGARVPLDIVALTTARSILASLIAELQPPFVAAPQLIAYAWLALLVSTGVALLLGVRRWHLGTVLATAALAVLSTRAYRAVPFFAWAAVPAIAASVGGFSLPARLGPLARGAGAAAIAVAVGLVVTNRFSRWAELGTECRFGVSRLRVPTDAVDFAHRVGLGSTPFNTFESGGYLAWRLYPEQRIFIDGRGPAYPEALWQRYFHLFREPQSFAGLDADYGFDWAFLYHRHAAYHPLAAHLAGGHGWTMVYYDELASLYVPTDDRHREMRERAAREFAELAARRQPEPTADGSSWRRIAVPIEEPERQGGYGDFLRAIGRQGEAIAAYERALALRPDAIWTRYKLGTAAWLGGNPARAIVEWQETLRRDPRFAPARQALAQAGVPAPPAP